MSVARTTQNAQNGVTLIELVVTLTVLAIITGFVGRPLVNLVETKLSIDEQTDQQADIEYALSRISNEIRFGSGIPICSTTGAATYNNVIKIPKSGKTIAYKYFGTDFVVENKESKERKILVNSVNKNKPKSFSCEKLSGSGTSNLYELILESDGKTYMVRALQRQ